MMDPKRWISETRPQLAPSREHKAALRCELSERIAALSGAGDLGVRQWSLAGYFASLGMAVALVAFCLTIRPSAGGVSVNLDPCDAAPELCAEFRLNAKDPDAVFLPVLTTPSPPSPDFRNLGAVYQSLARSRAGIPTFGSPLSR